MSEPVIHGNLPHNNLLHIEVDGNVYHVAVSGDGWHARCVELGVSATGRNQSETLGELVKAIRERLRES